MSFAVTLCLVLVAVYGLTSVLLSTVLAAMWYAGLSQAHSTSSDLLALRLIPSVGAAFLTMAVVLPAFLIYEPRHEVEQAGPLLVMLVILAIGTLGHGALRGWQACAAAAALLRHCGVIDRYGTAAGQDIEIVHIPQPMVAVVGAWRPRMVAARSVLKVCSGEEFRQVMAHEAAHVSARDNLKLLLLLVSPDALAWIPAADALVLRWREAAELEADARATGSDPRKRVALASALIKVARLSTGNQHQFPALSMPMALDDVDGRVRQLLAPLSTPRKTLHPQLLLACALLITILAVPLYGHVHAMVEALVALGR